MPRQPKVFHARAAGIGNRNKARCGASGSGVKFKSGDRVTCTLCQIIVARAGGSK